MSRLAYVDVETTGLDPSIHQVWEIAIAVGDGPIVSTLVTHHCVAADTEALAVSRYYERGGGTFAKPVGYLTSEEKDRFRTALSTERKIRDVLDGVTLVGANPAFDAAMLRARWGAAPWHFRLLDIEAYAMGALGHDRPRGLATIAADLRARGFDIPEPDHSAAADVAATRACHRALQVMYSWTFPRDVPLHEQAGPW